MSISGYAPRLTPEQHSPNSPPQPRPAAKGQGYDPERYFARLSQDHEALAPLEVAPGTLVALKAGYATAGRHAGRLALPVADRTGVIIGHFGVALDNTAPRIKYPTDSFNPDVYLFNWERVKAGEEFVYLTLDPMTAVDAIDNGIDNVVAVIGILNADTLQTLSLWMEEKQIAAIQPM